MKRIQLISALLLVLALPALAEERPKLAFELSSGSAYNLPTWLRIHQTGEEPIYVASARYDDKPFYEAPYYRWRIGLWRDKEAWEVELVHHKLYLMNKPEEVERFEISHGYNLCTVNRAWERKGLIWRLGSGVVLGHPESVIRDKKLDWNENNLDGFYVAGPTGQMTVDKRFHLFAGMFASLEMKFTASFATVPIADGEAYAPNLAVHGLFGLGYKF